MTDRRWWARGSSSESGEEARTRKPTVIEDLEQRLAETQGQLQAVLHEHRRATDEFEQAKARIRRDVPREVERGRRTVLAEMLEVLDNLDRAVDAASGPPAAEAVDTWLRGVELVREQFRAKLVGFGVTQLSVIGQSFNPELHEAVSTVAVDDPAQAGMVIAVLKEGYVIGDDLLRPASVVVGAHG